MRPVRRGASPRQKDFPNYRLAFGPLAARIGLYCSYCERKINTNLAVEHIQPKNLAPYAKLKGTWTNFLLGCVNCNSTKLDKDVRLVAHLLPDRDNTFAAYEYLATGEIQVSALLSATQNRKAKATLALVGLNKAIAEIHDENGRLVAAERYSQRMEAWGNANVSRDLLASNRTPQMISQIVLTALESGHFSIWMTVFTGDREMRTRLIDAFPGTRASGCFDANGDPVTPAPNPDGLRSGAKL